MTKKVYIDAGHGGADSGAVDGKGTGDAIVTKEDELNLKIAKQVEEALVRCKVGTKMSRKTDTYPTLVQRYTGANSYGADAFVSIHFNAGPSSAKGMEVLYPKGIGVRQTRSKNLATKIYNNLKGLTPWSDRAVYADRRGLAVLNGTKMPAVIVELEFITNNEAEKLVNNSTWQNLAGEAIAEAVCEFLGVTFVKPGAPPVVTPPPVKPPVAKPCHVVSKMPVLKEGAKGNYVKHLQKDLNRNGAALKVDGDFGPKTEVAVKNFQRKKKLTVDGIVGPKTWKALL